MFEYDVIIPVYKPDSEFKKMIQALARQTWKARKIILVNTDKSCFDAAYDEEDVQKWADHIELHHVTKAEFDHGATRNYGVSLGNSDFFVCMTDDAIPADDYLMEHLLSRFLDESVGIAYARQLPREDCGIIERYTRTFNYPEQSSVKSAEDLATIGIKAFFASNVCAAYRRKYFKELGGFPEHTIFNEDMIYARHLIDAGYRIAYEAGARVIHSHNYSGFQQFHRNFDLGVSHGEYPEVFGNVKTQSEGIRLVKQTGKYVCGIGKPWLLIKLIWQSGWKFLGYSLGKRFQKLPRGVVIKCSMNKKYWK